MNDDTAARQRAAIGAQSASRSLLGFLALCVLALFAAGSLVNENSEDEPSTLITLVAEYSGDDGFSDEDEGDADGPNILAKSMVVVDDSVLAAIDPWNQDVSDLPVIRFELFENVTFDVEFNSARSRWIDHSPWEGDPDGFVLGGQIIAGAAGSEAGGFVVLHSRPDLVTLSGHLNGFGEFRLQPLGPPLYEAINYWATVPEHECAEHVEPDADAETESENGFAAMGGNGNGDCEGDCPTACGPGCDEGCFIDLLVLYTPKAKETYEEAHLDTIEDFIVSEVEKFNQVVLASKISKPGEPATTLRVVRIAEVDHEGDAGESPDTGIIEFRNCLVVPWDGCLDEVHGWRDAARADLVALFAHSSGGAAAGAAIRPTTFSLDEDSAGFSATYWQAAGSIYTFLHEIGHNIGFGHTKWECGGCSGLNCDNCADCSDICGCTCSGSSYNNTYVQDFAFGWDVDTSTQRFATIMGGCAVPSIRIPYFSNPDVDYCNLGNCAATGESGCADNALTMRGSAEYFGTRFLVAQHRTSHDTTDTTTNVQSRHTTPPDYPAWPADDELETPAISANGQDIVFAGAAGQWGFDDNSNPGDDIYLFNRESGMVRLISHEYDGQGRPHFEESAGFKSVNPTIAGDRSIVAYTQKEPNALDQVIAYVRPPHPPQPLIGSAKEETISLADGSSTVRGNGHSDHVSMSSGGNFAAFMSLADNLTSEGGNGNWQIFLRDRDEVETIAISLNTNDEPGGGDSRYPVVAELDQGEIVVVFESDADDLVEGDTGQFSDIFLYDDQETEPIQRLSDAHDGAAESNGNSYLPSITESGKIIAFHSFATNLIDPAEGITFLGSPTYSNVYIHHLDGGRLLASISHNGSESGNADSRNARISPCGRYVAYESQATNLIDAQLSGGRWRVYLYDICQGTNHLASVDDAGVELAGDSTNSGVSRFGRIVTFENDGGAFNEIYLRDRGPIPGDLNGDGVVDEKDEAILEQNWGACLCCAADLNGDGRVHEDDLAILLANWGDHSCAWIESGGGS